MRRFFIVIAALAFGLWLACVLCVSASIIPRMPGFWLETLFFLVFSTSLLFIYLYRVHSDQFVQLYLLTMVVKLLAYGGFAVFVILQDRPGAVLNIGFFLLAYLLFTALELVFLFPKISR